MEHEVGFDEARLCQYEVFASEGFSFKGVDKPMKVAYVKEEYLKGRKKGEETEEFWVLTTDETLSAMAMRELAHLRWRIENNGFKQLNGQTNCDHVYTHEPNAFEALTLMLFIGFNLLQLFNLSKGKGQDLMEEFGLGKVRVTFDFVSLLLLISFFVYYGFEGFG